MPLAEVGWSGRKRPTENWQGFYDKTEMMGRGAGAWRQPQRYLARLPRRADANPYSANASLPRHADALFRGC
jgi:hypothetical protein